MNRNPLFDKPLPIETMMAVVTPAKGLPRVIRLEPELPIVERLSYPNTEEDPNVDNPIAFLGMCALAVVAILFAAATYIGLVLGNDECDCPSYILRRQSGRGTGRRTYHLPNCPNKEKVA